MIYIIYIKSQKIKTITMICSSDEGRSPLSRFRLWAVRKILKLSPEDSGIQRR